MLIKLLALTLLTLSGTGSEASQELDAVLAYYGSMVRVGAITPCKAFFPEHAEAFQRSYDKWLQVNDTLVVRGEKAARAAAEEGSANAEFNVKEAEAQFAGVLESLPTKDRLPWCKQYF